MSMNGRLRALCDLAVGGVRDNAGLHEYDGRIQGLRMQHLEPPAVAHWFSRRQTVAGEPQPSS
jgi:hypothetical protein